MVSVDVCHFATRAMHGECCVSTSRRTPSTLPAAGLVVEYMLACSACKFTNFAVLTCLNFGGPITSQHS
jgi:hypothetical protein